ncbi:hypothetical protein Tco_0715462 [Tanacetum coccineum]
MVNSSTNQLGSLQQFIHLPEITPFIPSSKSGKIGQMSLNLIEQYSALPGLESIKNQESKKSPKEIIRIKREQGEEKQDSTYSIRSTDKVALKEFDLKSALFKHMNKNKTANRNPANYHLYHALMEALIADEDAMDKEVAVKVSNCLRSSRVTYILTLFKTLTPAETRGADIMKALKGKLENAQGMIAWKLEAQMKELWEADVVSEHFDRDDNARDDNEETKPDPDEIFLCRFVQEPNCFHGTPSSTRIDQDIPSTSTSQTTQEEQSHVIPTCVEEDDHGIEVAHMDNDLTKDHPLDKIIGDPSRPVCHKLNYIIEALALLTIELSLLSERKVREDAFTNLLVDAMKWFMSEIDDWRRCMKTRQIKDAKGKWSAVELYFARYINFSLADTFPNLWQEKLEFL